MNGVMKQKAGMQRWIKYNRERMDAYYKGKLKSLLSEFDIDINEEEW